jgi:predicted Zn-dependent peptidase
MQNGAPLRSRLLAVLLAFCLTGGWWSAECQAAFAAQDAAAPVAAPSVMELALPNGLKVVLLEDHTFPVVSCLTWYHVGARNETPGSTGITHLLEHLLFGSVGSFHKGDIAATVARVGGRFNGYTSDDFTTFFETLPSTQLELALRIESERMRKAAFNDADVLEEVANIQKEFDNESSDGNAILSREVRAMLYLTHPYHNPTMGWRNDIENLNGQTIRDYYNKYFWPDNCTIVISGDFQPNAVSTAIHKYFGSMTKAPHPVLSIKVSEPAQHGERRIVIKYPGKQEIWQSAYHAPAFDDADAPAMSVLEKLMNAPLAGRLKSRLVDAKVCTAATASFEAKKDPGYFSITCNPGGSGAVSQQKIGETVDSLVAQLRTQPVSDVELRRARNLAELAYYSEQEGPYRAGFHLGYFDTLSRWQNAVSWPERLRTVSAADIQRVSKRYLNPDNRVIAWLAGAQAPHPLPAKPPADNPSPPPKTEHSRLTGYKSKDTALAPARQQAYKYVIAQAKLDDAGSPSLPEPAAPEPTAPEPAAPEPTAAVEKAPATSVKGRVQVNNKSQTSKDTDRDKAAIEHAIEEIPSALPTAVKDLPAAIGGAPGVIKELPNAVEKVPTVIRNIPSAINGLPAVIKEIPGAVGSIPSAIKEIPGAIGGLPGAAASAVKSVPSAIGGIPTAAATTLKELPGTIGAIPGAAASAIKNMPGAIGSLAVQVGTMPGAAVNRIGGARTETLPAFRKVLKNGINLVVFETHLTPVVQVEGAIQAGTAYDPVGKVGLSETVSSLLNLGTSKRARVQVLTQQEDLGMSPGQMLKFRATTDSIKFSTCCLSRDLVNQLGLLAETLSSPASTDTDVDHAKQDLVNQLKAGEDTLGDKAQRALMRSLLAPSSPFCPQEPVDLLREVPAVQPAEISKFLGNHVVPGAVTIVVAGDVNPEHVCKLAEDAFAGWTGKGTHQRLSARANLHQVLRTAVPSKDKSQALIGFGQLLPISRTGPEFGNLLIADAVLSNHPIFSRLNQKIAKQPELARAFGDETIETAVKPLSNALAWSFIISVEPNAVPVAVKAITQELKELADSGITAQELTEVKRYLLGALPVRSMSTVGDVASTLLETCIHSGEGEGMFAELNTVRSANVDSVNKTIRNALKPDQATMVIVGSPQSIRAVRRQVSQSTPAENANTDKD